MPFSKLVESLNRIMEKVSVYTPVYRILVGVNAKTCI